MRLVILSVLLFNALLAQGQATKDLDRFQYPVYLGLQGGYGSTTWQGLVPAEANQNEALIISTPTRVTEGGGVWGIFAGYEFSRFFAVEAGYLHYPKARIFFDENSLFAFENEGETTLETKTEMVSLMGKVMLVVPNTALRAYSAAGIARVQRNDDINRHWRCSPTFAVGLNYNWTPRIMSELAANYTAGYGESEISPVNDYIPFLYSITYKLAFRF